MTKLSVALVVAVVLAACSKSKPGPQADDCAAAVDKIVDQKVRDGLTAGASAKGAITPEIQAEMDRMKNELGRMTKPLVAALTKACTDDKWSADVIACLRAATTDKALETCNSKLDAEQRDHAEKAAAEAMASATPKGDTACNRYADLEIKCSDAGEDARPTILDFCTKARAGARDATYQLIKLESTCAETTTDCDAYKACVEKKKRDTTPE